MPVGDGDDRGTVRVIVGLGEPRRDAQDRDAQDRERGCRQHQAGQPGPASPAHALAGIGLLASCPVTWGIGGARDRPQLAGRGNGAVPVPAASRRGSGSIARVVVHAMPPRCGPVTTGVLARPGFQEGIAGAGRPPLADPGCLQPLELPGPDAAALDRRPRACEQVTRAGRQGAPDPGQLLSEGIGQQSHRLCCSRRGPFLRGRNRHGR
jgi:hypothetical protein